ncbi:AzlD domain-containing protein [Fructobacillus evanidus]|uniref:AzlD domain-containing protein n=1 Tax=Fructobacillus evanidus TaxID=3064281 RepID=UPI0030C8A040
MSLTNYILFTIITCGLVTWVSRIFPFVMLKKFDLPEGVLEFLSFVPITIMAGIWFESLFVQHLGHLPSVNWSNLWASLPTVATAVVSKNLLLTVVVGVISFAVIDLIGL